MANKSTIKSIRLLHRYMGLFFAPAILFFSFTGALQTFSWHETSRGSSYQPPAWIVRMAQLHKKQTFVLPAPKPKAAVGSPQDSRPTPEKKPAGTKASVLVLKCFVFVMSIGLALSTLLGIAMAFFYGGDARVVWAVVLAGIVLPIAVTLLQF